ncbi:uncharacterized protein LOC123526372 [Mercenaria mercenaria]|uniref:uncharacterized protein LOC123526372 n=1 Tax=Mercenaria mercenaria TaxID=6596 RepID=UPI001E1D6948|nr:uncharacterized protein LOC123526372 [Mercenaria mercenaria]
MFERQDSNSKINFFLTMDDNTVQVVPTYQAGITVDTDGNIVTIPTCIASCDADGNTEVSNYVFNSGATNYLGTDAIHTMSAPGQSADAASIMDVYNGIKDKNLADAATRALVDGDFTPLIKEELKYSIQSKRMKEGKPELKVEFLEPEPDKLTEEELERVEKRKVQNRMAARRFRDRQRTRGDQLQKECQKLQSSQTQLRFELSQVKKERDELKKKFEDHLSICPLRYTHQFYNQPNNTG